ncbi:hypothetical protein [Kitasatospora sp. KL5]|uniref:hypothetical protein n=1 Tax=Kitasatospora sp. KL5 TaxID=3425125 RepID=UPI003D6E869E
MIGGDVLPVVLTARHGNALIGGNTDGRTVMDLKDTWWAWALAIIGLVVLAILGS